MARIMTTITVEAGDALDVQSWETVSYDGRPAFAAAINARGHAQGTGPRITAWDAETWDRIAAAATQAAAEIRDLQDAHQVGAA